MKGQLHITRPGTEEVEFRDVTVPPTLKELQELVGGYIEEVPGLDKILTADGIVPCVAYCDEEGKYKDYGVNGYATARWAAALGFTPRDVLVGTVVIIVGDTSFMHALLHGDEGDE